METTRPDTGGPGRLGLGGVRPGAELGGYLLQRELGRGGNAVVFQAVPRGDPRGRPLALKVLRELTDESLTRFRREATVVQRLGEHPGIVPVFEHGEDRGRYYLVMELCPGQSLKDLIDQEAPLQPERAIELLLPLCDAVGFAHARGVIHRDLKPGNVMLDPSGRPRVLDFGLAAELSLRRSLTTSRDVRGTPAFMAPEAFMGARDLDARADVYALGAILFQALTGRRPFDDTTAHALAMRLRREDPPAPSKFRQGIPRGLDAVCQRALARDRDDRYSDASALAQALRRGEPAAGGGRRRLTPLLLGGGLALLLAGALGAALALAEGPSSGPAAAPDPSPSPPLPPSPPSPPDSPASSPGGPAPTTPQESIRRAPPEQVDLLAKELRTLIVEGVELELRPSTLKAAGQLVRRYPEDPVARIPVELEALTDGANNELAVRRRAVRALQATPPELLPPDTTVLVARLCWNMGFQRAAADLLRPFAGKRFDGHWTSGALAQVHGQTDPPVFDLKEAFYYCKRLHELRQQPRFARFSPTELFPRDIEVGFFLSNLEEIQAGEVAAHFRMRGYRFGCELTPRLRVLNAALFGRSRGDAHLVRDPQRLARLALQDPLRSEFPAIAALYLVTAARIRARAGDSRGRLALLNQIDSLRVTAADVDVRDLARRQTARAILAGGDEFRSTRWLSLARDLARAAAGERDPDPRTPGERADAWILAGRAELELGELEGARGSADQAEAQDPWDRRELDRLRDDLRRRAE